MSYTTILPTTVPPIAPTRQKPSSESTLETRVKAALEHARRLTEMHGSSSTYVAIAWETVEELQTAKARQPRESLRSAFDRYCAENPHALEARIYDV